MSVEFSPSTDLLGFLQDLSEHVTLDQQQDAATQAIRRLFFKEFGVSLRPIDQLSIDLLTSETQNKLLVLGARSLSDELGTMFAGCDDLLDQSEPLSKEPDPDKRFEHFTGTIYDADLPTLGISYNSSFCGSTALGLAAQQRRQEGRPSLNVVYLPVDKAFDFVDVRNRRNRQYYTRAGYMVDEGGRIVTFRCPEAIRVDMLEDAAAAPERLKFLNRHQVPRLTSPEVYLRNKVQEKMTVALETGIKVPRGIYMDKEMTTNIDYYRQSITDLSPQGLFVVKPFDGRQGNGVKVFESAQLEQAVEYIQAMSDTTDGVLIEEFIDSVDYIEPASGLRKDWNVRAITVNGQTMGMFARVGNHRNPVNYAQGAEIMSVADCLAHLAAGDSQKEKIKDQLQRAADEIARISGTGVHGLDITVDKSLEPVLFEVNSGIPGGFDDIVQLADGPEAKLAIANKFIDAVLPLVGEQAAWRSKYELCDDNSTYRVPRAREDTIYAALALTEAEEADHLESVGRILRDSNDNQAEDKYNWLRYFHIRLDRAESQEERAALLKEVEYMLATEPHEHHWYNLALTVAGSAKQFDKVNVLLEQAADMYPHNDSFAANYIKRMGYKVDSGMVFLYAAMLWFDHDNPTIRNGIKKGLSQFVYDEKDKPDAIGHALREFIGECFDSREVITLPESLNRLHKQLKDKNIDEEVVQDVLVRTCSFVAEWGVSLRQQAIFDWALDELEKLDPQAANSLFTSILDTDKVPETAFERSVFMRGYIATDSYSEAIDLYFQETEQSQKQRFAHDLIATICDVSEKDEFGETVTSKAAYLLALVEQGKYEALQVMRLSLEMTKTTESIKDGLYLLEVAAAYKAGDQLAFEHGIDELWRKQIDRFEISLMLYGELASEMNEQGLKEEAY